MARTIDQQAAAMGYTIRRGSYSGTSDNRIDRWYVERLDASMVDRRGNGFASKRAALESLQAFAAEEVA